MKKIEISLIALNCVPSFELCEDYVQDSDYNFSEFVIFTDLGLDPDGVRGSPYKNYHEKNVKKNKKNRKLVCKDAIKIRR